MDINYMPSGSGIYSRISKETIQGAAATERSSHGRLFGYANLEARTLGGGGGRAAQQRWMRQSPRARLAAGVGRMPQHSRRWQPDGGAEVAGRSTER